MSVQPTWFGSIDRPLAGWLLAPAGDRARAGVVICPPIGLEYVNSQRALRDLASEVAAAGFAAFGFDYDGTGDSSGLSSDPDRVGAWLGSVSLAVAYLRSTVGTLPIAVVGVRLGATLASHALAVSGDSVDALVLWDPEPSGRRFFRQQRALGLLGGGDAFGDGTVDAPGFRFERETVERARSLELSTLDAAPAKHVLVLHREDSQHVREHVGPMGAAAKFVPISGQGDLFDLPSPQAVTPSGTLRTIADWLDETLPAVSGAIHPLVVPDAVVPAVNSLSVAERMLRVGGLGLFAIETRPTEVRVPSPRAVLLLNMAVESHVGPVRLWTELARLWASQGLTVLRVDISGIGDSPARPGAEPAVLYGPHAVDDVAQLIQGLGMDPSNVTLVGLCSGAHLAVIAGKRLGVGAVLAVNPVSTGPFDAMAAGASVRFGPRHAWPRNLLDLLRLHEAARQVAKGVRAQLPRVPAMVWALLVRARLISSPASGLFGPADVPVLVVCGPEDAYGYVTRGKWDLRKLAHGSSVRFLRVHDLAHVPHAWRQRTALVDIMTEYVIASEGQALAPPRSSREDVPTVPSDGDH